MSSENSTYPTVVLVHGAFADAAGFAAVIGELETAGLTVLAPANPLRGLRSDAEAITAFVSAIEGPVVLVGHSYGGAVITQAAPSLPNVTRLVYLAAFAPDEGETCLSVQEPFATPLGAVNGRPTPYPAPGAAGGPDIYIDRKQFRETFCADLPVDVAEVMAVTQRPVAAAAVSEPLGTPGWRSLPSWFLVSEEDQAIHPGAERFMAERMGATVEGIKASHCAYISQPVAVADFIRRALSA